MKVFVLLVFIPSLITADILCPNSKATCPEDKLCCKVDGEYSCCDPDDEQDLSAGRMKVYAGVEIMGSIMFENGSFSANESTLQFGLGCDLFCSGTCCEGGCCPHSDATCCAYNRCCPSLRKCCSKDSCCPITATCCGDHRCCPDLGTCCKKFCCKKTQSCCGDGCCSLGKKCCGKSCCEKTGTCCGDGCCSYGTICCGSWCCLEGYRCGSSYHTCINKGATISAEIAVLLLMAASIYISHLL